MKKLILLICLSIFLIGCTKYEKEYSDTGGTYEIIRIKGYTYYRMGGINKDYMAPTPETIKMCMYEVMNGNFNQKDYKNAKKTK